MSTGYEYEYGTATRTSHTPTEATHDELNPAFKLPRDTDTGQEQLADKTAAKSGAKQK